MYLPIATANCHWLWFDGKIWRHWFFLTCFFLAANWVKKLLRMRGMVGSDYLGERFEESHWKKLINYVWFNNKIYNTRIKKKMNQSESVIRVIIGFHEIKFINFTLYFIQITFDIKPFFRFSLNFFLRNFGFKLLHFLIIINGIFWQILTNLSLFFISSWM